LRFALYLGAVRLLWILEAHHVPTADETPILIAHMAWSAYRVALVWIVYLALEPYARRMWPHMLVSWVRVLNGYFRDPLLGRDGLLGICAGVFITPFLQVSAWEPERLGFAPPVFSGSLWSFEALRGTLHGFVALAALHTTQTIGMLSNIILFLVLRLLLRRTWLAIVVTTLLAIVPAVGSPGSRAACSSILSRSSPSSRHTGSASSGSVSWR
jgi:hypothetical protein